MRDISLHILDIAENALRAGASLIEIDVTIDDGQDLLQVRVQDNGCGMSGEMMQKVRDPFTTSRETRHVGLGIPLLCAGCERTGRGVSISSAKGRGTSLTAEYAFSHIDRPPIGDIAETLFALTAMNPGVDFVLTAKRNGTFVFDTREVKQTLQGVPVTSPEVSAFLNGYLKEGTEQVFGGSNI